MTHPFLDPGFEIKWSQLTPDKVVPDIEEGLRRAKEKVDRLAAMDPADADFENAFLALEDATEELGQSWGRVSHMTSVADSPDLRKAYNAMLPKVSSFFSSIPLNDGLWKALKGAAEKPGTAELDPVQKRFVDETLADFRDSGADLPPEKKERVREISEELSNITQKYSENDLDALNAFELVVEDAQRLEGLPEREKEAARQSALKKGYGTDEAPKWRFTLHAPSLVPVLKYAEDADLRKELYEAFVQVGREEPYCNLDLVKRILALRSEKAKLLGKENFADVVTERRMAKSGQKALSFVEDMHDRIFDVFQKENVELEEYKAEKTGQPREALEAWEGAYWGEKLRKERYDFDEEELRPYFSIGRVLNGLFSLTEKIFGIRVTEREGAERPDVWHEDVRFYDIHDAESGRHMGSFYADWHPRPSKRSGAWMNNLRTGKTDESGNLQPHLGLMCGNLAEPVGEKPALLSHREVQTIFHEFGHLIHHLLGEVPIRSVNGIHVYWDFVELPSQIMENWCWERDSLDLFARHYESDQPIPQDLFEKMLAARNFMAARFAMRQLCFGKTDLELHLHYERYKDRDIDEACDEIQEGYRPPTRTDYPFTIGNFGHLFSDPVGYAAGYYSYKWAEVLDADAFTRFKKEGVMNGQTGRDFRAKILSKGNSAPPDKLFRDFMGRDPDAEALLVREGLA